MAGVNRVDRFLRWQFYLHYIYSPESPIRLSDDDDDDEISSSIDEVSSTTSSEDVSSSTGIVPAVDLQQQQQQHRYNPIIMLEKRLGHDPVAMIWSSSFTCIHLGLHCDVDDMHPSRSTL